MDDFIMEISIPTDVDGFILLQCSLCGEYFKLQADEMQSDDIISIWCPCCGLIGESYFTEDVIELALNMLENQAIDLMHKEMNEIESSSKNELITIKAGRKPTSKSEEPIISGIVALELQCYSCCKRKSKIKPIVKFSGGYCPYCGVKYDGDK